MQSTSETPEAIQTGELAPRPTEARGESLKLQLRWIVALCSCGIILVALYAIELFCSAWYFARLESAYAKNLESESDLSFILDNPKYAKLFVGAVGKTREWRPIIAFIMQSEYELAARQLRSASFGKNAEIAQLRQSLENITDLLKSREELQNEARSFSGEKEKFKNSHENLVAKVRSLLTGEKRHIELGETAENKPFEPRFYESGLLVDFPVIDGLPDSIADFKQLVLYYPLKKAHESLPPEEDIRHRIEELRNESHALKLAYGEFLETQSNNEAEIALKRNSEKALGKELRAQLKSVLLNLQNPKLDARSYQLYNWVRSQAKQFQDELPELKDTSK